MSSAIRRVYGQNAGRFAWRLPIGAGPEFVGIVDLMEEKAYAFELDSRERPKEIPIPEEMKSSVAGYRDPLLESVAAVDEGLLAKYLEGTPMATDEVRAALRRGTISNTLVPVLCGAASKNMGVAHLLDAIISYLPSPVDLPPVEGKDPHDGQVVTAWVETESFLLCSPIY